MGVMADRRKPKSLQLKSDAREASSSASSDSKRPDEEKIREVLRELRMKNVNVEVGLARLEKLVQSPGSHIEIKQQPVVLRQDYCLEAKERLERCRIAVSPHISNVIRPNQRLLFGEVNILENFPELYCSESGNSIAIVGPRNIRRKTRGVLRVADHIVSVNSYLVSDWLQQSIGKALDFGHGRLIHKVSCDSGEAQAPESDKSIRATQALRFFQTQLISLAKSASGPHLIFGVLRDAPVDFMALSGDWVQVEIIHLPNDPSVGLGFGIVGGASTGVVIKTILQGSAADKDKRLKAGDRILQIGRINVQGFSSQQVAALLRQHDATIELIVGRSISLAEKEIVDTPSCWTMATKNALTPTTLEEQVLNHIALAASSSQPDSADVAKNNHAESTETESTQPQTSEAADRKESTLTCQQGQRPSSSDSKTGRSRSSSRPSKTPSTDQPMSLKNLQETALTTFCSENWVADKYETIDVELERDPSLGLGITVAGYVHKKEEITGVFVKSLVPNSSAHLSKQIQVHDLIVEVNGRNLEKRKHADAVKTLVKSGPNVKLRIIRFHSESPQAVCLKMLHEQEMASKIEDVQSDLIDYKSYWSNRLGSEYEIIIVDLKPDKHQGNEVTLGLSLEGTVDIVDGTQLCPHHFIESKTGPAAKSGLLKAGDELLQVNEVVLYGESHVTVRQELSKAAKAAADKDSEVRLFLCRKAHHLNLYMPSLEQSLPLAYPLLASAHDGRFFKAKSEFSLSLDDEQIFFRDLSKKLRSRSLEQLSSLAIWNCVPIVVSLEKGSRGLGFSVIDYQDPLHHKESVIVVRALVPGGVAQADGRITPGDRLLFVNDVDLSNSTLQNAVEVLKKAPMGLVKIGIAKPVPVNELNVCQHSPIITRSERLLARLRRRRRLNLGSNGHLNGSNFLDTTTLGSATSSQEEIWVGADLYRRLNPQLYFPSSGSGTPTTPRSHCSMFSWTPCSSRSISPVGSPVSLQKGSWAYDVVVLPPHLERSIKLMKGALPLGIVVDANVDKSVNGCVVKSVCSKKAVGRDSRIQVGDYIVRLNTENMRNVTNSQAKAIIKRTNLVGTQCNVSYITAADAQLWTRRFHQPSDTEPQSPVVNRLSPKVHPKFYQSPFLNRRGDQMRTLALRNQLSQDSFDDPSMFPSTSAHVSVADNLVKTTLAQLSADGRKQMDDLVEGFIKGVLEDTANELSAYYKAPDWSSGVRQKTSVSHKESVESVQPEQTKVRLKSEPKADEEPLPPPPPMTVAQSSKQPSNNDLAAALATAPKDAERKLSNGELVHQTKERPAKGSVNFTSTESAPSTSAAKVEPSQTAQSTPTAEQPQQKRNNFWGEARTVVLNREPNETFGVSIVGGRVEVSQKGGLPGTGSTVMGIFVKSVMMESPAGRSSKIFMGDRIISVNDIDLRNATHEQAVQAIKNAKNPVRFVVQSLQSFTPDKFAHRSPLDSNEPLRQQKVEIIHQQTAKKEVQPASSTPTAPMELEVKERIESKPVQKPEVPPKPIAIPKISAPIKPSVPTEEPSTSTATRLSDSMRESMRRKVEPESAAALTKDPDDPEEEDRFCYTAKKIERKYGNLPGKPTLIKLADIPPNGLGLSLAGKNVNLKKSVFVVDVKSTSLLPLQAGDELLEINGRVLFGQSHQSASIKIRECCEGDELALLILRPEQPNQVDDDPTKPEDRSTDIHVEIKTTGEDTSGNQTELAPKLSLPSDLHNNNAGNKLAHPNNNNHAPSSLHDVSQTISLQSSPAHFGGRKKSWQMERVPIETGKETLIEIDKNGKGLGLSIVGGTDTVLGSIVIHEIYPDGAAATDGRMQPGDQILEVNGTSLSLTHDQAIAILRRTPAKVRLLVYRDVNLQLSLLDPTQIYNIHEIELQKRPGRGLGISIVGRKDEPGVYISEVVKGGVAEQDGRLLQGDQILNVCGQDVSNKLQEDVATLLKTLTGKVTIKVGRWKLTDAANKVHAAQPASRTSQPSSAVASPQVQRQLTTPANTPSTSAQENAPPTNGTSSASTSKQVLPGDGDEERRVPSPAPQPSFGGYMATQEIPQVTIQDGQRLASELSPVTEEPGSSTDLKSLSETAESGLLNIHEEGSENILIHLKKGEGQQWGMGIGKRPRGILITSLQPGSTAAEKLLVGDRIMAVNGTAITDQHSAVSLIKSSGNEVKLQMARPINNPMPPFP